MTAFVPQNSLETLLVQATEDIGARPAFYRAFLSDTLLVICNAPNAKVDNSGHGVAKVEDIESVVQMRDAQNNFVIPVFSSFARLQETGAGRVTCAQLEGRKLLLLLGTEKPIVLNPASEYSKLFTPEELVALQDGSIFSEPEHTTYAPDAQVQPGLPVGYPEALADSLRTLFTHYPGITKAYLASLYSPGSAEPPTAIVGMDLTDDWFTVVRDASVLAGETLGKGQSISFLPLRREDPLADYMLRHMEPFYIRGQ